VLAWGRVFAGASGTECALADPELVLRNGAESGVERRDLGAFEYPLVRLPVANQAWYQARFTLQAADLLERRGLEFVVSLLGQLPEVRERGGVHRSVVALEPSFRTWFRSFGEAV